VAFRGQKPYKRVAAHAIWQKKGKDFYIGGFKIPLSGAFASMMSYYQN
jgi:hypothetical protein